MTKFIVGFWIISALAITILVLPVNTANVQAWDNQYGTGLGTYWDFAAGTVHWYVHDDFDSDLVTSAKLEASVAGNYWDDGNISGSNLDFEEGTSYTSADVHVEAAIIDDSWEGGLTTCDLNSPFFTNISECWIDLDETGWDWYTDGGGAGRDYSFNGNDRDVFTVSAHEFGHSVGFRHKAYGGSGELGCDANNTTGQGNIQIDSIMCSGEDVLKTALNAQDKIGVTTNY